MLKIVRITQRILSIFHQKINIIKESDKFKD